MYWSCAIKPCYWCQFFHFVQTKNKNKIKKTPSPTAISAPPHSSNFLRLESRWRWWKTGSNWERKQNRYKLTPATQSCIGRSASRDTFETSAYLYACLPSETFAVSVALPALSHPRLMILVLCNLTVTVHHLSNARLFFSPFTCHNRRSYNYDDIVIVVSCCFYNTLCRKMDEWFTFVNKCEYIYGVPATFSAFCITPLTFHVSASFHVMLYLIFII